MGNYCTIEYGNGKRKVFKEQIDYFFSTIDVGHKSFYLEDDCWCLVISGKSVIPARFIDEPENPHFISVWGHKYKLSKNRKFLIINELEDHFETIKKERLYAKTNNS